MSTAATSKRSRSPDRGPRPRYAFYTRELEPLTEFCETVLNGTDGAAEGFGEFIPCKRNGILCLSIGGECGQAYPRLPRLTRRAAATVAAKFFRDLADKIEAAGKEGQSDE